MGRRAEGRLDLDGEVERLRAEARQKLEGERELEEKLAGYERELRAPPTAAAREGTAENEHDYEDENDDASVAPPLTKGSLTAAAAEKAATDAASRVSSLSTPKLVAYFVVLIFGAWIVERLIGPIVALAVLVILGILGYRFLKWLTASAPEDDADKDQP